MCRERCDIKLEMCVDLGRIRRNLIEIKQKLCCPLTLMLKADAYGHGMCEVATATQDIVDCFGVVCIEEAFALRERGVEKDILVCACSPDEIAQCIRLGCILSLHSFSQLDALVGLIESGKVLPSDVRLHLKIDSGMRRLGFCNEDACEVLNTLVGKNINLEGVFSHLRDTSTEQRNVFEKVSNKVRSVYGNCVRHLASSHSLDLEQMRFDAVRVGLFAYRGAMRITSKVIATRRAYKGDFVSYGNYRLENDTNLATVFGGYADGLANTKRVWIASHECRVVGNVCMDMFVVDCGEFMPNVGDRVLIIDSKTVNSVANDRGVSEYEVYTAIGRRVERRYEYDQTGGESRRQNADCRDEKEPTRVG